VQQEIVEKENILQVCRKILFLFTIYYLTNCNAGIIKEGEPAGSTVKTAGACISNCRKTLFLLIPLVTGAQSSTPTILPYLISRHPLLKE